MVFVTVVVEPWLAAEPLTARGMGERMGGWKWEKTHGWRQFNSKARATHAGSSKQGHSFTTSSAISRKAGLHHTWTLMSYGVECPLGQLPQLSCVCPLPHCAPRPPARWGSASSRAGLGSVSTAQLQQKHPRVSHALSSMSPKCSLLAPMKQMNYPSQNQCIHSTEYVSFFPTSTKQQLKA